MFAVHIVLTVLFLPLTWCSRQAVLKVVCMIIVYIQYQSCYCLAMQVQRQLDVDILISGHTHKVSPSVLSLPKVL